MKTLKRLITDHSVALVTLMAKYPKTRAYGVGYQTKKPLQIKLREDQRKLFEECAKEAGLLLATWAREMLLEAVSRTDLGDFNK